MVDEDEGDLDSEEDEGEVGASTNSDAGSVKAAEDGSSHFVSSVQPSGKDDD